MSNEKNYSAISNVRESILIMKKEMGTFLTSPMAYIIMTIFLITTGVFFFMNYYMAGQADMRSFFQFLPWVFSFFIPAITMRFFSEENNTGSVELLMTMPLTVLDIVVGKLLAATAISVLMLIPTVSYAVSVYMSGSVDLGPIVGGYLGAVLLAGAYSSLGIFASSLTKNQVVALLVAFFGCFFLTAIDQIMMYIPGRLSGVIEYVGTSFHFRNISKGLVNSRDVVYFLTFIVFFVITTVKTIEDRR